LCVAAIDAHADDALVQQVACHALELIAFGGAVPCSRGVAEGVVGAVLRVLKTQRGKVGALRAALAALQAILSDGEGARQRVVTGGGLKAIVDILGDAKGDANIQYWGRLLLQSLCAENHDLRAEAARKLHWKGIELDLSS